MKLKAFCFLMIGSSLILAQEHLKSTLNTNVNTTNIVVKETDIKETDIKETDIKETDIKETDVNETDVKETDVKETDVKEQQCNIDSLIQEAEEVLSNVDCIYETLSMDKLGRQRTAAVLNAVNIALGSATGTAGLVATLNDEDELSSKSAALTISVSGLIITSTSTIIATIINRRTQQDLQETLDSLHSYRLKLANTLSKYERALYTARIADSSDLDSIQIARDSLSVVKTVVESELIQDKYYIHRSKRKRRECKKNFQYNIRPSSKKIN